jgi:hypothetical protein
VHWVGVGSALDSDCAVCGTGEEEIALCIVYVRECMHACVRMRVCVSFHVCTYVLEDITTEPHAHEISADIVRVWLSDYILQQYVRVKERETDRVKLLVYLNICT